VETDLLLAAAALHDVGKIHTYRLVVGASQKTDEGYLLDHVFISASMVSNVCTELAAACEGGFDAALRNRLLHAILAHHGKLEWGAPVLPQTPEALLLNFADHISATMKSASEAIDGKPAGEDWTQYVHIMDARRRIFAPGPPPETE
jgi:3'-5' exoribonuclease